MIKTLVLLSKEKSACLMNGYMKRTYGNDNFQITINKKTKEHSKMRAWETKLVKIIETPYDYDLHEFAVYNKEGKFLGTITPATIDNMQECIEWLDEGSCPIEDEWEDGNGNICTLNGWE